MLCTGERGAIVMVSSIAGIDGAVLPYGTSKGKVETDLFYCCNSLTKVCVV
jgi:NAD(P)-dependent dehydrogenase (short-subunit alcohol dehydrogenase family)